jgi:hypothetical protein
MCLAYLFDVPSHSEVEDTPTHIDTAPPIRNIQFELTKESLEVVLGGLQQIKKQLDAIG